MCSRRLRGDSGTAPLIDFFFPYGGFDFTETNDPAALAWLYDPAPSFVGFEYNATLGGNNVVFTAGSDPLGSDWGGVEVVSGALQPFTQLDNTNTVQVPEPATWLASLLAAAGLAAGLRRRSGVVGGPLPGAA